MSKGVLVHKPSSHYDDVPNEKYHFPKQYLGRLKKFENDWIIYYGINPSNPAQRGYYAVAKVAQIIPDVNRANHYYAQIEPNSFLSFNNFVPYVLDGRFLEVAINTESGKPNGGVVISAVRGISNEEFNEIVSLGLKTDIDILPRIDDLIPTTPQRSVGFQEEQKPFELDVTRQTTEVLQSRKIRDRLFRRQVINAYKERCAITGWRLINGGGRAEVEAAHIKPVEQNGPDDVRNGLALSGTVHWMFDRGLIALSEDYDIQISRKVNNRLEVQNLINDTGKALVPDSIALQPHPAFLAWHRKHHRFE